MESRVEGAEKRNFATMDGVRGVAALCVMFHHFTYYSATRIFPSGYLAVDIFFCLSGFVIANSYEARLDSGLSLAGLARIRLIRLYPLYCLGLVLGLANYLLTTFVADPGNGVEQTVFVAVCGLFLLPMLQRFTAGVGGDRTDHSLFPLNPPSWSLFVELLSNAIFAVFRPRGWTLAVTLVALAALFVDRARPGGWASDTVLVGLPRALLGFYLGTALRQLWGMGLLAIPSRLVILPLVLTLIVCSAPENVWWFIASALVMTPAIVSLTTAEPRSHGLRVVFGLLGEISYPVYALHMPAFGLLKLALNRTSGLALDAPPPLIASVALGAGLAAACLALVRFYDRPIRRRLTALTFAPARQLGRASPRAAS